MMNRHGHLNRALSLLLAICLVMTMLPLGGQLNAHAFLEDPVFYPTDTPAPFFIGDPYVMPQGQSVVPLGVPEGGVSPTTLHYNFFKAHVGDTDKSYIMTINNYSFTTAGAVGELNPEISSAPWMYHSYVNRLPENANFYFKYAAADKAYGLAMSRDGTAELKILVSTPGSYQVDALIYGLTTGVATAQFSLHPLDNGQVGQSLITKEVDTSAFTGEQSVALSDTAVSLAAGEYVFRIKSTDSTNGKLTIVNGLTLTPSAPPTPSFTLSASNSAETTVDDSTSVPLTITATNIPDYNLANVQISATPVNSDIAEAEVVRGDNSVSVLLTGKAVGNTQVNISAQFGSYSDNATINVTVASVPLQTLHYNFFKANVGDTAQSYIMTINDYSFTTTGAVGELKPEISSAPWMYHNYISGDTSSGNFYFKYPSTAYALALSRKGTGELRILVPTTGTYDVDALIRGDKNGVTTAQFSLYTLENGQVGQLLMAKTVDTSAFTGEQSIPLSDTAIYLTAGEYVFRIKSDDSTKDKITIINGLKLIPAAPPAPSFTLSASNSTETTVNDSTTVPLAIAAANIPDYDLASVQISATPVNSDIVEAEVVRGDNSVSVLIVGKSAGSTQINISAQFGGYTGTATVNVTVQPKQTVEARDLYYNFFKANAKQYTALYVKSITYNMTTTGAAGEVNPVITSDPWAFFHTTAPDTGNHYFKYNETGYALALSYAGSGSLKIKVPADGLYEPLAVLHASTNTDVTVSLHRLGNEGVIVGDALVSSLIADPSTTGEYAVGTAPVQLTAGEYVMRISHTSEKGLAIINGFKLINVDKKLAISANPSSVSVVRGEQATTVLSALDFQSNAVPAEQLQYTVESSNTAIATASVTVEGGQLKLTAQGVALGNCNVTVSLSTQDGKKGKIVVPVTVTASYGVAVTMDMPDKIKVGQTTQIPVRVQYTADSVPGDDAPADITVSSSSATVLTASVTEGAGKIGNTLNITPVSTGTASLTVTVTVGEVVKTFKYAILVYNDDIQSTKNYQYMIKGTLPTNTPLSTADTYLKVMQGTGEQLRPGAVTDTWCFAGKSENATFLYTYDSYGSALQSGTGTWGAIKIRLPESGIYQAVSHNALYPMAGIMRLYIAPADAVAPRDSQYTLGTADTFTPGDNTSIILDQKLSFGIVELQAGDYVVTWEIVGQNPGLISPAPNLYISGLLLNAVDELPAISLSAEPVKNTKMHSTTEVALSATASGSAFDLTGADITITPDVDGIVDAQIVTHDGKTFLSVTGTGEGDVNLALSLRIRGQQRATLNVPVKILPAGTLTTVRVQIKGSEGINTIAYSETDPSRNQAQLEVLLFDEDGDEIPASSATRQNFSLAYRSGNTSVATVNQTGLVAALIKGNVTIYADVAMAGANVTGQIDLTIASGKTRSSYYTETRVSAARTNAAQYTWAAALRDAAVASADMYVDKVDLLWESVTTQELPRSYHVGYRSDPDVHTNRYTGENLSAEFGSYPWIVDPIANPWKVKCPKTGMLFPSNDFGSFYKLGIDENGNWDYELAKSENQKLVDAGQPGYLVNILYPEKGEGWGVDDGYGYHTGEYYTEAGVTIEKVHTYISYYNHWGVWHGGLMAKALTALRDAYIYTGDPKYGRVGAILIDRIADIYPAMDTAPYKLQMTATGAYAPKGKIVDLIWEHQLARNFSLSYDAFFPMYDDPYVVNYLSAKASQYQMVNAKTSSSLIRENVENGILREIFRAIKVGQINGNFGMHQSCLAYAAVVLDTMPETKEWIDWVFQNGEKIGSPQAHTVTGGNVIRELLTAVDRDGMTNEIAPQYSDTWAGNIVALIDALAGYDKYPAMDMYENPILIKMLSSMLPVTLTRSASAQIGDSGSVADQKLYLNQARLIPAFEHTGDPIFAQMLYFLNGNKTAGLHYNVYTQNPNRLAAEVQQVIAQYGEYDFDQSEQIPGYGFSILRDGTLSTTKDTQRDMWMFYGRGAGHGHLDVLNIGMSAYGVNIAPDLAYPIQTTGDVYTNWGQNTIAHNTVVVNSSKQSRVRTHAADVMHFDDSGQVKVMDADAADRYPATDIYRRTVVMVNAGDDISYGIDFFRIKGGTEHLYSFHALSQEIAATENLTLVPQADGNGAYVGSYAGASIPYAQEGNTSGKTWLRNVDRDADVSGQYAVDFKIEDTDTYDRIPAGMDLRLRLTMVNSFDLNEVAIAEGVPAQVTGNPSFVKFLLAKRSGTNLDSLFTTVLEPYDTQRYIASIEAVPVTLPGQSAPLGDADGVKAVKVTLTNGRVDYIFYAANNTTQYEVDGLFTFTGFVGVYSLKDNAPVYQYINDGTELASQSATSAYTGTVENFTTQLSSENSVTVRFNGEVDLANLTGRFIYIDNGLPGNAAFPIRSAVQNGDGSVTLDTGDVRFVSGIAGSAADDFTYLIAAGNSFRIPLPAVFGARLSFNPVSTQYVTANNALQLTVRATSSFGGTVNYSAVSLPSGARLSSSGVLSWTPGIAQVGQHQVVIRASDSASDSTLTFTIHITAPANNNDDDNGNTDNGNTPPVSPPTTPTVPTNPELPPVTPPVSEPSFTDLAAFTWAQPDIYALAKRGIIQGTSTTTFAPQRLVSRAEFAVLVVRAFNLTAVNNDSFADVPADAYYSTALSAAKNSGIIQGVGENRFNPTGDINREDLMLMIVRALKHQGIELTAPSEDVLAGFTDSDQIAPYALEAVKLLVANGILQGSDGKLNPKNKASRAETAVLLNRILTNLVDQADTATVSA